MALLAPSWLVLSSSWAPPGYSSLLLGPGSSGCFWLLLGSLSDSPRPPRTRFPPPPSQVTETTASAPTGNKRGQQTPPGKTLTCSFIFVSPPCAPYQESSRGRSLSFLHPNARTRRWSPPSPRRPPKRRRLLRAVSRARRRVLGHYLHSELNFPLFGLLGHDPDCLCITGCVQKCFGTFGSIYCPQTGPDCPQTGPRLAPRPQTGPHWPQTGPRLALTSSRLALTHSRLAPDWPRLAPDWPQTGSRLALGRLIEASWLRRLADTRL